MNSYPFFYQHRYTAYYICCGPVFVQYTKRQIERTQIPGLQDTILQLLYRDLCRDVHPLDNPRVRDIFIVLSLQYVIFTPVIRTAASRLNPISPTQPRDPFPFFSPPARVLIRRAQFV